MQTLSAKTLSITGARRGAGQAIALDEAVLRARPTSDLFAAE